MASYKEGEQQRIDEARFGAALLTVLDLPEASKVLEAYLKLRQGNWTPPAQEGEQE